CGLKGLDRTSLPIDQSYAVLTVRKPTSPCCRDADIPAAMQGEHELGARRARDNDAMMLGTARKLDHGIDDALASGDGSEPGHDLAPIKLRSEIERTKG